MTTTKTKNRNISVFDFFKQLQLEYLSAELRFKIYPSKKDKKYWSSRVMEGKKVIIENIAHRNNLKTIFNDPETKEQYDCILIQRNKIPNFCYKDNNQKNEIHYFDLQNYFAIDSHVLFSLNENSEDIIGKIKEYKPYNLFATVVNEDNKEFKVKIEFIKRIL